MTPVRTCVIGGGHLGTIHTRLLAENAAVELVAVAEPNEQAAAKLAQQFQVRTVSDYRQLLNQVEAAVVAAPTGLHHPIVLDLLRHNVHVLVEKPITSTVAEADQLVAEAAVRRRVLQVGHVERFNPVLAAAAPHLAPPRYLEAVRTGPYSFRSTDIGVVLDLMIHDLDLVLSLVRSSLTSVDAYGTTVLGPHEDMAQARLHFANGCVANLTASRVSPDVERRLSLYWQHGSARLDFAGGSARLIRSSQEIASGQIDVHRLSPERVAHMKQHLFQDYLKQEELTVEPINAIQQEQMEFLASIRQGTPVRVSGQEARDALSVARRVLDAIAQRRGTQPRSLPAAA
jgi:predicted dehydrogenase